MSDSSSLDYEPGVLRVLQTKSETKAFYDKIAKVSRGDRERQENRPIAFAVWRRTMKLLEESRHA